jgi:hypothetical protein
MLAGRAIARELPAGVSPVGPETILALLTGATGKIVNVMFDTTMYAFAHGHALRRRGSISHSRTMRRSILIFCSLEDVQRPKESRRCKTEADIVFG